MAGRKRLKERRKHNRYRAREGAYAAISPKSYKLGQIVDISMGGLSFHYIDTGAFENNGNGSDISTETMFLSSMGYYVGDLSFETIADYEMTENPSFSNMTVRKRHIKFTNLELKQLFDLDYYIRKNTENEV